jgi:phospholipid/cholesterol/gamma-HCH transport system substrate-binding protein
MNSTRQLLLGGFFVVVFALLGVYTLFLTDFSLFREQNELVVHFSEAGGLRSGDSVLVAGIREGRVRTLAYDPEAPTERRVTVTLLMDTAVALRTGYDIAIEEATVLGGKQVSIDPGPFDGAVVATDGPLPGRVKGGALDGLGKLVDQNSAKFSQIVDDLSVTVADLRAGKGTIGRLMRDDELANEVSAAVTSVKSSFEKIDAFAADIRAGKGVLGRLATDDELASKLEEVVTNLQAVSGDLKGLSAGLAEGQGTLGRLFKDEKLSEDVASAVATIKDIVERVNKGEGALWLLLEDEELKARIKSLGEQLDQGTLGKLINNDEIYQKLSKIADDIAAATGALRNAEGTLGKLVMDKDLYEEVQKALAILTRTLQEFREAAPVTTFTSLIFAGF